MWTCLSTCLRVVYVFTWSCLDYVAALLLTCLRLVGVETDFSQSHLSPVGFFSSLEDYSMKKTEWPLVSVLTVSSPFEP